MIRKYTILNKIGQGAFGAIYKVTKNFKYFVIKEIFLKNESIELINQVLLQILMKILIELFVILLNEIFKPLLVNLLVRLLVFFYSVLKLSYITF